MTKLVWGRLNERHYEFGVDRGVFYPNDGPGVAWTGLIKVTESSDGGQVQPLYYDGQKILELVESRDYVGSVTAFSVPHEFGPCEGNYELIPGFIVTRQIRETFAFSYCYFTDVGYKIGLVWNATATKSSLARQTMGDSVQPAQLEYQINAVPPRAVGYRPTAHMIVDSKAFGVGALAQLEEILYGTKVSEARMPTQAELLYLSNAIDGGIPPTSGAGQFDGGTPPSPMTSSLQSIDGGGVVFSG